MTITVSTQIIRGREVPFFTSPMPHLDLPWVATYELVRAYVDDTAALAMVDSWKRFPESGRLEAKAWNGSIVSIMPHSAAQGLVGAIDELLGFAGDEVEEGPCFRDYTIAGACALKALTQHWSTDDLFAAVKNQTWGMEAVANFPKSSR